MIVGEEVVIMGGEGSEGLVEVSEHVVIVDEEVREEVEMVMVMCCVGEHVCNGVARSAVSEEERIYIVYNPLWW